MPKLAFIVTAGAVALVATAASGAFRGAPVPAAWRPAALLLAAVALATATSISRPSSVFGTYERYGGLLPLVVYLAVAALGVVVWWRRPASTVELAAAVVGGAAVVAVYVLVQVAGLDPLTWEEKSGAAVRYQAGSMGNSNFAAGYLGAVLPLLWLLWKGANVAARAVVAATGALVALALLATEGRGGLVAALIGLATLALLLRRRPLRDLVRDRRVVAATAALALTGGVAVTVLVATTDVLRTESVEVRRRQWDGAVEVFLDRPLTGTGPDTFGVRYPQVRSVEDARELGLQVADKPHNLLLEYASGTGVVGLAAFVYLLVSVARGARRGLPSSETAEGRVGRAFLAVLAGHLAQAMFSFDTPPLALLFWVSVAVVVCVTDPRLAAARAAEAAAGRKKKRGPAPPRTVSERRSLPVLVAAVAVALLAGGAAWRGLAADLAAGRSLRVDGAAAQEAADRATRRHPYQTAYWLMAGAVAERRGAEAEAPEERRRHLAEAVHRYREGHDLEPRQLLPVLGLARTFTLVARTTDPASYAEADAWWREAARLDPKDWEVRTAHALMLNSWANAGATERRRDAIEQLQVSLELRPEQARAWGTLALLLESVGRSQEASDAARRALAEDPGDPELRALVDRLS